MRKPTEKQKKFVIEKSKGLADYRAAINAGYDETTAKNAGKNIVESRGVQTALAKWQEAVAKRDKLSVDKRLDVIESAMEAVKQAVTGEWYFDIPSRLKAVEYLNTLDEIKATDKHDVDVHGDLNIQVVYYTDPKKPSDDNSI